MVRDGSSFAENLRTICEDPARICPGGRCSRLPTGRWRRAEAPGPSGEVDPGASLHLAGCSPVRGGGRSGAPARVAACGRRSRPEPPPQSVGRACGWTCGGARARVVRHRWMRCRRDGGRLDRGRLTWPAAVSPEWVSVSVSPGGWVWRGRWGGEAWVLASSGGCGQRGVRGFGGVPCGGLLRPPGATTVSGRPSVWWMSRVVGSDARRVDDE
jgi:hypothetical protein